MTSAKRALDVGASLVAFGVFGPVLVVAAALIKAEDGGPVLFWQERCGRALVPFQICKLRTMRDGEVTRVGRWLRRTGIDEVAQFVNVLRGEMTVVGPRPLTRADLQRLGWLTDADRAALKPGITGPAQVLGGQGAAASRRLDRRYADEMGVRVDVELIAISFAINLLGKHRVRAWLAAHHRFAT